MEGMHGENLKKGWEPKCGNSLWEDWERRACVGRSLYNIACRWAWFIVFMWWRKRGWTSGWHFKPTTNDEILKEDREVSFKYVLNSLVRRRMRGSVGGTYKRSMNIYHRTTTTFRSTECTQLIISPLLFSSYKIEILKIQCTEFKFNFRLIFSLIHYASIIKHYLIILVFSKK